MSGASPLAVVSAAYRLDRPDGERMSGLLEAARAALGRGGGMVGERQVLAYAALGHSNKHIAYTLGLAPSTVSSHLHAAMRQLGVQRSSAALSLSRDRAEAAN